MASLVLGEQLFVLVVKRHIKKRRSTGQWHANTTLQPLLMGDFLYCYYLCPSFGNTVLSADVTRSYVFFLLFIYMFWVYMNFIRHILHLVSGGMSDGPAFQPSTLWFYYVLAHSSV